MNYNEYFSVCYICIYIYIYTYIYIIKLIQEARVSKLFPDKLHTNKSLIDLSFKESQIRDRSFLIC